MRTAKKGDVVVHKKTGAVRTVVALYDDIKGGVILDKPVEGFVSWNVADLRKKRSAKRATRT